MSDSEGTPGAEGRLQGRVAIVTGGARGLGAAIARAFVREGADVIIGDLLEREGAALADELGARCHFQLLDVTSPGDWESCLAHSMSVGPIRVLVNNAGILQVASLEAETPESFMRVLEVNLLGSFLGLVHVIGPMRQSGGGSVVNVSSLMAHVTLPNHAAYSASKSAQLGLSKVAALELAADGIRVNSVLPGAVQTPLLSSGTEPNAFEHLPLGRAARPEEVAELVVFLCCDDSAYITGAEILVDGGLGVRVSA